MARGNPREVNASQFDSLVALALAVRNVEMAKS